MKLLFATLLLLTLPRGLVAAAVAWQSDYEAAMAEAPSAGKPLLLYFTASWCGPCRMMAATTFADVSVQQALEPFIAVKIDHDQNPELIGKYHIQGVPTLILLNRFGETVASQVGYVDAPRLTFWLASNRAEASAAVSKAQLAREKATALVASLESLDSTVRQRGIAQLFTSYLDKDDFAPMAGKLIEKLVERRREEMLPYLNDEHLAIRILLANLFAKETGPAFTFDPWAPTAEREAAMRILHK